MTGLYIHIPFCARKCPYCDFYSLPYSRSLCDSYVGALVRNIGHFAKQHISIDSVYFGGGTPSLLCSSQVKAILGAVNESFEVRSPEVTLEANPCTADLRKLSEYREAGVNRLSFGVQSANDSELEMLGRLHDFKRAEKAVYDAVKAGFDNISCDIMLGTAYQTVQSLENSVDALVSLPVQHISAYMLKIEKGTAYDCDEIRNAAADEDLVGEMYLRTVGMLADAGFAQYEISNFAKPGFESRHNLKYWTGESYIGIGASAHSFFGGRRYYCPKDIQSFVSSERQIELIEDEYPDELEEYLMLGLRLSKGVELQRFGENAAGIIRKARFYEQIGLCSISQGRLSLTPEGFLVSNSLITEFSQCL